jgi:methionine biosynthesis protein MetW
VVLLNNAFNELQEQKALEKLKVYRRIFPKIENKRILDLGCSSGIISSTYVNANKVFGVDKEFQSLKKAKTKKLFVVQQNLDKELAFKNNSFDFVICTDVLEHLINTAELIREINRILKKEGLLLINVPNELNFFNRIKILFGMSFVNKNWFSEIEEYNYPHLRFFTRKGLKKLLEKNNFKIIKDFSNQWSYKGLRFLSILFPALFAPGITFLCQKNEK